MASGGINHMSPEKTGKLKNNPKPVFTAKCVDCKKQIEVSKDGSTESKLETKLFLVDDSGELFNFTYYDCPYCGRRHLVTVDDEKSSEIFKKLKQKVAIHGKPSGIKKLQRDLDLARKAAYGKIEGVNYFDPDSGLSYDVELLKEADCGIHLL